MKKRTLLLSSVLAIVAQTATAQDSGFDNFNSGTVIPDGGVIISPDAGLIQGVPAGGAQSGRRRQIGNG